MNGIRNIKEEMKKVPNARTHWGKGIIVKNKKVYHPYTEIGFKFDNIIN